MRCVFTRTYGSKEETVHGGLDASSELGSLGENAGVEFHGFGHVSLNFHLAVHEGVLRLQLTSEELQEVVVEHDEGGVGLALQAESDLSVSVLQVNRDDSRLVTLGSAELEVVDSTDLGDDGSALRLEERGHFLENFNGLEN